ATPSKASLLLLLGSNAPDAARQITVPGTELRLPGRSFACYQLTSALTEQHYVRKTASRPACTFICICVTSLPCRIVTPSHRRGPVSSERTPFHRRGRDHI